MKKILALLVSLILLCSFTVTAFAAKSEYTVTINSNENATITPITDGTRAGFVIERSYMHSTIKQTVWLYSVSSRIDFETEIDWHEHHQVVKAAFPLDILPVCPAGKAFGIEKICFVKTARTRGRMHF